MLGGEFMLYLNVVIKENEKKAKANIVISCIMLLICILMVGIEFSSIYSMVATDLFGILGSILFGFNFIFAISRYRKNDPLLVLGDNGIIINQGPGSVGFIDWNNIANARIEKVFSTNVIVLDIINIEKVLSDMTIVKKMAYDFNVSFGLPAVRINIDEDLEKGQNILTVINKNIK